MKSLNARERRRVGWVVAALSIALAAGCAPRQTRELPPPDASAARRLETEGIAAYRAGRYLEARRDFDGARRIFQAGDDRGLAYANVLQSLAETERLLGDSAEAERLLREALRIRQRLLPPDDRQIGRTMNNLALTLQNPADAEAAFRSAIANLEAAEGPNHVDVAVPLASLSDVLRKQHRCAEAETLARRSLAIRESQQSPAEPDVGRSLVAVANAIACDPARYAEAEPYYVRCTRGWEASLGTSHPLLALGLIDWADAATAADRLDLASQLYSRALRIEEATLPPDHPGLARTRRLSAELERKRAGLPAPSSSAASPESGR